MSDLKFIRRLSAIIRLLSGMSDENIVFLITARLPGESLSETASRIINEQLAKNKRAH
jgi:hypothetical protein